VKLGSKIILAALGAIALSVIAGLIVQRSIIYQQGIRLTQTNLRNTLVEAESVRDSISDLNKRNAFDYKKLTEEFQKSGDLRNSTIYATVPVVAAWNAIEEVAKREGYEFRIPKHQARNSKNTPTPEEEEILKVLESGEAEEYFRVDKANNQVIYARPIMLTQDCLLCHGDPKNSSSGDGKDLVGFPMEGWKVGEVHGAFVLKSKLTAVDQTVAAGMTTALLWILPLAGLIVLGFYFFNNRVIVRPLTASIAEISQVSEQTTSSAGQMSAASQSVAEGASEQAASLEETSASLEEMASMTRRNAENAQSAKELANQTRSAADTGAADMQLMNAAVGDIKESSDNIAKIIKTIDEIAFQTNILALNAAVEAARAGEAGMGFAVVADEVRNLAQRSAQAAKETAEKIEDAIQKSDRGVQISDRVARSLQDIVDKARRVDELVAQIAAASGEQSTGIAQVNQAVTQMDKVTQSNAANAEESASAAEELSAQARTLQDTVGQIQALLGRQAQAKSAPVVSPRKSVSAKPHTNGKAHHANGSLVDMFKDHDARADKGALKPVVLRPVPRRS
jgi:methyl-accepting chemotaxis protein